MEECTEHPVGPETYTTMLDRSGGAHANLSMGDRIEVWGESVGEERWCSMCKCVLYHEIDAA